MAPKLLQRTTTALCCPLETVFYLILIFLSVPCATIWYRGFTGPSDGICPDSPKKKNPKCLIQMNEMNLNFYSPPSVLSHIFYVRLCLWLPSVYSVSVICSKSKRLTGLFPICSWLRSVLSRTVTWKGCFKWAFKRSPLGTSLVVQWLSICLPMQETRVRALVQEDPTCHGATKPMYHNYWARALESPSRNYWAHVPQLLSPRAATTEAHMLWGPCATTTEALTPRTRALQQEKPPQWEAHAPQRRVAATRESLHAAMKTQHSQK